MQTISLLSKRAVSCHQPARALLSRQPLFQSFSSTPRTMAIDYEAILRGKYPAKLHAQRVVQYIRSKVPDANGILYLEGRHTKLLEDSDMPEPFRQRRPFFYLTGCSLPDSYVIHDIETEKTTLFIPPIDPDDVIWSGLPMSVEEAKEKYDVDEVKYSNELNATLACIGNEKASVSSNATVFAIAGQVSEKVSFLNFPNTNFDLLKEAIGYTRVIKDEYELALIAKANAITAAAHHAVMKQVKNATNERELEALFLKECIKAGAKKQAYDGIFAAGTAAATLHYVKNDEPLGGKQLLLVDAGCEWECYASDITRAFPINGKFTPEARAIYDIVLRMQTECIAALKEGVVWDDVHVLAHKIAIEGLSELGILKGDKDEILAARTSVAFYPHGLGHYLGLDTHDTGGNPNYNDPDPFFRYLRVRGKLPAGAVITVEPGIYFCRFIIEPYLKDEKHAKFIDAEVLERYWAVGGVRIEDNILITKDGSKNLSCTIKDPEELEKIVVSS